MTEEKGKGRVDKRKLARNERQYLLKSAIGWTQK